jgi:hypothetical protein
LHQVVAFYFTMWCKSINKTVAKQSISLRNRA